MAHSDDVEACERAERDYCDALDAFRNTVAPDWPRFVAKLEEAWEDVGSPPEEYERELLANARQLVAEGR